MKNFRRNVQELTLPNQLDEEDISETEDEEDIPESKDE
jgi:hypothetical protein